MSRADGGGGEAGVPATNTPRRRHRDTRSAILDAAAAEVEATGRLSVNAVAARAGVSRQSVHHHVGGLRGLQAALRERGVALPGASEGDTRERLIDAAVRILSQSSGDATLDDIAAEAGLTKGALYHHFPDRISLLREVARRISPVQEIAAAAATTDGMPDAEAIVTIIRAYRQAMVERGFLVQRLVGMRDPELIEIVSEEIVGRGVPLMMSWWRERVEAGGIRPVSPFLVFQALFGSVWPEIVFGPAIVTRLHALGGAPAAEWAEAYVDMLMRGIAAHRAGDAGAE